MEVQGAGPSSSDARLPAKTNPPLPELRLVLLGRKGTGKSSTGNTILGLTGGFESSKPTEECVKRKADVANHHVTVVDTPGWEWYYSGNGTPSWVTRETIRSVSLCPPGPHALLLVARSCASVTDDYYRQVEKQLELLGKNVWAHTMLLFTRGDELGTIPIEQRIQNGKSLKKLLERCGNRFHVLENKRCGKDETQVKELIGKIEAMVKERGGRHYESDPLLLGLETEGKRRARERRKKQRIMEAQTQRGTIKAVLTADTSSSEDLDERSLFSRGSRRLPELRLILLGERETGKSSAGNAILRGSAYFKTGQATEECLRQQAETSGRQVTVVDVPGWEGSTEGITTDRVKREICASVALCPPGPHALLLTLRVDALVRAPAVKEHLALLGEGVWRHTMLLFTRGDQLREGVTIEQHIQGGGRDLQWLMEKCGSRYHVISSSCTDAQITGLLEKVERMVAGNRCEAFSPIVQEIQELGKQKNDRFNQKLKDVQDKLQRQEMELKRMREREVKSIRWFFDRRKDKVKSPEKTSRERDGGTDKVEEDRKSIMGELEERMAWLTEDKEREIQDLSLENSRVITALNRAHQEKTELVMNLDEKERESEEWKEKVDELQVKVMELERLSMLKEQERKKVEEELNKRVEDSEKEVCLLKEKVDQKDKELRQTAETMAESDLKYEEEILQQRLELQRNQKEKDDFEEKLKEMEELQIKTSSKVREQEERGREAAEKWETEKNKLREMITLMTKEMEGLQIAFQDQVKSAKAERQMHESTVSKYNELLDKLVGKDAEITAGLRRQKEQEQEMRNKLEEKELEIKNLQQALDDKHQSLEDVRNVSEATVAELNMRIKCLEDEYKEMEEFQRKENVFLKEEIEAVKKTNEENARKKEDDMRRILEMKENTINQLQQENVNRKADVEELQRSRRETQIWGDKLENQNAVLRQEIEELQVKCDNCVKELQDQKAENEKRENKMKDVLNQYEEMGKIKDALNQENIEEKDKEISSLKQIKYAQQTELEITSERVKELELKIEEMRKYYEDRLSEKRAEMDVKEAERELELHNRELELSEREQTWRKNVQELERGKRDLKKQEDEIIHREELLKGEKQELKDKEVKLEHDTQTSQRRQEDLEIREREMELKQQEQTEIFKKQEKELENIRQWMKEKEKELETIKEELDVEKNDVEDHRKNLDIREKEIRQTEQRLTDSEQICECKMQELLKAVEELEKNKHDHERRKAELTEKESIVMERLAKLHKKEEDIIQREHDLQIKTEENQKQEQELLNERENHASALAKRQEDLKNTEHELEKRKQELEDQFRRNYEECESLAKMLESKQREFSEKQEKELKNIKQQRDENEKELRKLDEGLTLKRRDLTEEKSDVEKLRESLDIKEKEITTREQAVEAKMQEMEKEKHDHERWQADLTEKEGIVMESLEELHKKQEDILQREHDLQIKIQELLKKSEEIQICEQELLKKKEHHANEFKASKSDLARREQDLMNTEYELEKREKDLDMKENEIRRKYEECEALEKMLESKQREFYENQEKELKNIKQQLDEKEKELRRVEEELTLKQRDLMDEKSDVEKLRQSLDIREQVFEVKTQELSKVKRDHERWEVELRNKELDLEQRSSELQELWQQNQQLSADKCEGRTLDMWEQELQNKEDELQKKEHDLKTTEIYLEKREIVVQKREGEAQVTEQQHQNMRAELKKKQEMVETKQLHLVQLENELVIKERNITSKEQDLSRISKELDVRQRSVEKQQADLKSSEQMFKELESKRKYVEDCTIELEKQKDELNIEKQVLQMKSEQLEKWGKYLYNMELRMINNNPSSDFQPWNLRTVPNGKQEVRGENMYQEVGVDVDLERWPTENGNGNADKDESVEMVLLSQTSNFLKSKRALDAGVDEESNGDHEQENGAEEFFIPASSDRPAPPALVQHITELRLMLIGEAWSSRQSGRSTILGQNADIDATNLWRGSVSGKPVLLVEPHGIKWRSSSTNVNMTFRKELMHGLSMCMPGPHAFVLLLPAYLSFTARYRRAVEGTMSVLGEAAWSHAIVLFTWAEALGESIQQHVKRNGDLEWLMQKCGGRCLLLDNRHRDADVQRMLGKIYEMVEANCGCCYQAE